MLKKPYKTISQENGDIRIFGNGHSIPIDYKIPEWSEDKESEACFEYKGNTYFISEFMLIDKHSHFKGFDGYSGDSFFSGVLIKLVKNTFNEYLKAYTYLC